MINETMPLRLEILEGIPIEKINIFLEAGIIFRIDTTGTYEFIIEDGRVFIRQVYD